MAITFLDPATNPPEAGDLLIRGLTPKEAAVAKILIGLEGQKIGWANALPTAFEIVAALESV